MNKIQTPVCPPTPQCQACPVLSQSANKSCEREVQAALQQYQSTQNNKTNANKNQVTVPNNNINNGQNNGQFINNRQNNRQFINNRQNNRQFINNGQNNRQFINNGQNNGQVIRPNNNFNNQFAGYE